MLECIGFNNSRVYMGIFHRSLINSQRSEESDRGFVPVFWTKNSTTFQGLSRTPFSALSLVFFRSSTTWPISFWRSFCVCSFYATENLGWIKLAPKFEDFPALTVIFKDFQGLRNYRTFKDFLGASELRRSRYQNLVSWMGGIKRRSTGSPTKLFSLSLHSTGNLFAGYCFLTVWFMFYWL